MNIFDKLLLQLNEMSDRSLRFSLFILKCLCKLNYNYQIEMAIAGEFPIDHTETTRLIGCSNICEKIVNIKLSDKFLKGLNENEFASNEDYALSILNKYFTSKNRKRMRLFLVLYNTKNKITEDTIFDLYTKFHSQFNK